jgi:hypothetical protein
VTIIYHTLQWHVIKINIPIIWIKAQPLRDLQVVGHTGWLNITPALKERSESYIFILWEPSANDDTDGGHSYLGGDVIVRWW